MTRSPDTTAERLAWLLDHVDSTADGADRELQDLVHLVDGLRDLPAATPHPAFRARLRDRLLVEAATLLPAAPAPAADERLRGLRERVTIWRRSASLALVSALSATSIGGVGVAVASQQALPGDALYGLKGGLESARMAVASGDLETGRLHLAFARARLEEVVNGLDQLTHDQLIDTLQRMDEATTLGANDLLDVHERTGDLDVVRELASFLADQRTGLLEVLDDLPVEVVPFAERSLATVHDLEVRARALLLHGDRTYRPAAEAPTTEPAPSDPVGTGDGTSEPVDGGEHPAGDSTSETGGDGGDGLDDPVGQLDDPSGDVDDPLDTEVDLRDTGDAESPLDLPGPLDVGSLTDTVGDLLYE